MATRQSSRNRPDAGKDEIAPPRSPEGPKEPFGENDSAAGRYLRQIYQEIHDASVYGLDDAKRRRIQDILRRTRSRQFWSSISDAHKAVYQFGDEEAEEETDDPNPVGFSKREAVEPTKQAMLTNAIVAFSRDIHTSPSINDDMLTELVRRCGYPLLSLCLHSESFLHYIETSQDADESRSEEIPSQPDTQPLTAAIRIRQIVSARASLELFAKVRHLDFLTPIRAHDEDFQLLVSNIFKHYNTISRRRDFGIRDDEMRELHSIEPWNASGKHWALSVDADAPAKMCDVTYKVTKYLKRDYPELELNEELTEPQEVIADSVFLRGYVWPNMDQWPSDDPREHSYDTSCSCCGYIRGHVPKPRTAGPQPAVCTCTLQDLQRTLGMPQDEHGAPRETLFEIARDGALGNGVRSLQNIHKGDHVGLYHGEMYPQSKLSEGQAANGLVSDEDIGYRYKGTGGGQAYIMIYHMARKRHRRPYQSTTKKTKKTKKKKNAVEDDDDDDSTKIGPWEKSDPDEYQRYAVDSALRGNWTRYLNHSCDANIGFSFVELGCKYMVALVARRAIAFGEWMTADYGRDYFNDMPYACHCGMDNCLYWNAKDKNGELRTLGEAMEVGMGPRFVRGVEGLPRKATSDGIKRMKAELQRRKRASERDQREAEKERKSDEGDLGKTHRSTKTSKNAAEDARETAEDQTEETRRSARQAEKQRKASLVAATVKPVATMAPAGRAGAKRGPPAAASGENKKARKG